MPQSLTKLAVHLIFSTKNRARLVSSAIRPELECYLSGILKGQSCHPVRIGVQPDHVHLLFLLGRTVSIADLIRELKSSSATWIKQHEAGTSTFSWQRGYAAFSVSESVIPQVIQYVATQDEHHRKVSFQDELRAFCRKHGVEIDERYVWD